MNLLRMTATTILIGASVGALPFAQTGGDSGTADATKHAPGIYLATSGEHGAEQMVRIVGSQPHEVKATGMVRMMLTQGLLKGSMQVELAGTQADIRTSSTSPTFYFYFDTSSGGPQASGDPFAMLNQVMGGDTMPSGAKQAAEFSLVHLTVTKDARRAIMGKVGSMGGDPKNSVECAQDRLARGAYTLRPKAPLAPGEYAFFYVVSRPGGGANTAWDFGVDGAK